MAEVFGNVNVKYNPCKSIAQLKSTADYILGKRKEQIVLFCIAKESCRLFLRQLGYGRRFI